MPKINFAAVQDNAERTIVPEGTYRAKVHQLKTDRTTQYGDESWGVEYKIQEGEHAGRGIWDNLVFSEAGLKRVKLVCARLGLDVSGEVDLQPDDLIGREILIDVVIEEFVGRDGKPQRKNAIPFAGFTKIGETPSPGPSRGKAAAPVAAKAASSSGLSEEKLPF